MHLFLMRLCVSHLQLASLLGIPSLLLLLPMIPLHLNWLWSENRKLLPTVFQEIQALCGRDFTLDAAASDSGDNAHCTDFCSPSNSFMSETHTGHIWINAPFTQLTTFVQHYLHCKQLSPDSTSACILVPGYLLPVLESMLSGMTCLKRYTKGAALFEHSTRSGHLAAAPSLSWPVYIFSDVPTGANQAFSSGQSMHRLHNATVLSDAHDSGLESDERLAMLFEGSFTGGFGGRAHVGLTSPILFDSGASSNFVSPRLLQQLSVTYTSSGATLRLANDSSAPTLGKVRLRFKLQSFTGIVTCYVTDLCDEFDMILGNSFMVSHRAVLDYSNFAASLRRHGRLYTLSPRSILTDKGKFPVQPEPVHVREPSSSSKSLPPQDKAARRANRADQHAKHSDCYKDLGPKLVLSCAAARKSIRRGCRAFLVLVTKDDVDTAVLAAASVTNSSSATVSPSPTVTTAPPADTEHADLLQHVDALRETDAVDRSSFSSFFACRLRSFQLEISTAATCNPNWLHTADSL